MRSLIRKLLGRQQVQKAAKPPHHDRPIPRPPAEAAATLPIAALTTVWNEVDYLRKWVDYYGGHFGRENLYVLAHGGRSEIHEVAEGCIIYDLPRNRIDDSKERRRARMIEGLVTNLLGDHRAVIIGDVDEYIVADPDVGTLTELVDRFRDGAPSVKPMNLNVLDDPDAPPIDWSRPVFEQRRLARSRYQFCKPVVMYEPARFTPGFHYSDHDPHTAPGLYLVHLHYADRKTNEAINAARLETVDEMPQLASMAARKANAWTDFMGRYERYNAEARALNIRKLDKVGPQILKNMEANIVPGNEKAPDFGKTMTYGKKRMQFRIEVPERFAKVF